jgi:hypothetical protein
MVSAKYGSHALSTVKTITSFILVYIVPILSIASNHKVCWILLSSVFYSSLFSFIQNLDKADICDTRYSLLELCNLQQFQVLYLLQLSALGRMVLCFISSHHLFLKLLPAFPTSTWNDVEDTFHTATPMTITLKIY